MYNLISFYIDLMYICIKSSNIKYIFIYYIKYIKIHKYVISNMHKYNLSNICVKNIYLKSFSSQYNEHIHHLKKFPPALL